MKIKPSQYDNFKDRTNSMFCEILQKFSENCKDQKTYASIPRINDLAELIGKYIEPVLLDHRLLLYQASSGSKFHGLHRPYDEVMQEVIDTAKISHETLVTLSAEEYQCIYKRVRDAVENLAAPISDTKQTELLPLKCFVWDKMTSKPAFYPQTPFTFTEKINADYEPDNDFGNLHELLYDAIDEDTANKLYDAMATDIPMANRLTEILVDVVLKKMTHGPCIGCKSSKDLCKTCTKQRGLSDNYKN